MTKLDFLKKGKNQINHYHYLKQCKAPLPHILAGNRVAALALTFTNSQYQTE